MFLVGILSLSISTQIEAYRIREVHKLYKENMDRVIEQLSISNFLIKLVSFLLRPNLLVQAFTLFM